MVRFPVEKQINEDMLVSLWCSPTPQKNNNKPKEYPNSNDMMGHFLRTGFVWLRHVNNSRDFDPRRRLGGKCKAQLAELSTEPFLKQQPFTTKTAGHSETNVQNSLGNTPKNLLGGESHLLQRTPEDKRVIAPRPLLWLKTPKLTLFRKMQKGVEGTGRQM